MNAKHARRVAGFTLMEVLISLGVISVVLALGAMAFAEVVRLRGAQDRYNQRLAAADFLLRRVARDVRAGRGFVDGTRFDWHGFSRTSAAPEIGDFMESFHSGPDTMIISTGDGMIIYRSVDGKVERIETGKGRTTRQVLLNSPGMKFSFDFESAPPDAARSVVTTAEWTEPPAIGVSRPTLSLRVALRGR